MTWVYIWLAVTVFSLVLEFVTNEVVSIWFAGGGFISLILALCGVPWFVHLPVFIVASFALLLCFRSLVMKKFNKNEVKTNADSAIGKTVKLLTAITEDEAGSIKIGDVVWTAVTAADEAEKTLAAGTLVKITDLQGNKYIVKEIKQ